MYLHLLLKANLLSNHKTVTKENIKIRSSQLKVNNWTTVSVEDSGYIIVTIFCG